MTTLRVTTEITDDTPLAMLTVGQLRDILRGSVAAQSQHTAQETETQYVRGIQGIADLFKVSKMTAQLWKDSWLRPAVHQTGRTILTDVAQARKLYEARCTP